MNPLTSQFWIGVGLAVFCGGILGIERQMRGKPAGIRTSILICLATSIFVHLGNGLGSGDVDPTRVLAQVVTGVGFLGAGVIMAREGLVVGVTSAAVIWVLASVGCLIGFGKFISAVAISIISILILTGIELLEKSIHHLRSGFHTEDGDKKVCED